MPGRTTKSAATYFAFRDARHIPAASTRAAGVDDPVPSPMRSFTPPVLRHTIPLRTSGLIFSNRLPDSLTVMCSFLDIWLLFLPHSQIRSDCYRDFGDCLAKNALCAVNQA
jgi:hypothetical protein